jgi:hypothetical protein
MNGTKVIKRCKKVWIIALFGGLISGAITLIVVSERYSLGLDFLIGIPFFLVQRLFGLEHYPADSFFNSMTFGVMVNTIFGSLLFGVPAALWWSMRKGDDEN